MGLASFKHSSFIARNTLKKKIVIVCDGTLQSQPRVLTQIKALKDNFNIELFGNNSTLPYKFYALFTPQPIPKVTFHLNWIAIIRKPISAFVKLYIRLKQNKNSKNELLSKLQNAKILTEIKPSLVIAHGLNELDWVVDELKKNNIPFIINMHEYYPLEFEDTKYWLQNIKPRYEKLLRLYASQANAYFVVCNSIIKKYETEFGLKNQILIRNTKPFFDIEPIFNNAKEIRMIHHGICNASRHLELTIEVLKFLPEHYKLDLMLVPDTMVYPQLIELAKNDSRIRFIAPVETKNIIPFINSYDIGLFLLPPVNFNYLNALPNKLFEFIQARLATVVSPNPEMKAIVEEYDLGLVSKDYTPEEFAKTILSITKQDMIRFKHNANKAAVEINDESEQKKIFDTVNKILCVA